MQTLEPGFQRRITTLGAAQQPLADHRRYGQQDTGIRHAFDRFEVRRRFRQLTLAGEKAFLEAFDRRPCPLGLRGITFGALPRRERGAALARPLTAAQATGLDRMTDRRFTHTDLAHRRRLRAPLIQTRLGYRQDLIGKFMRTTRCSMAATIPYGFQTPFPIELLIAK